MKTETAILNLKTIADNLEYECSRQELRGYAKGIKKYIDAIEENLASGVITGEGQLTIPVVSSRLSFARFVAKSYDIRTDGNRTTYAEIATGDNYTENEIYGKWLSTNGC